MYTYIVMVLFVTLMPLPIPFLNGTNNLFLETVNLIPFRDLRLNYYGAVREIFLNIIMMIPFGFLYPIIRKVGILKTVTVVFLFSLTIESTQLLSAFWGGLASRSFDVTDLITNTFGGLVGYLFFSTLKPIIFKIYYTSFILYVIDNMV
jgi:glycopeptide antibiotics resistance protein